jgi:hypothetical protein
MYDIIPAQYLALKLICFYKTFAITTCQPQCVNTQDDARQRGNMFVERKIVLSAKQRTRIILYTLTMLTATQCILIDFNTHCLSTTKFHRLILFRNQSKNHTIRSVDNIRSFEKCSLNREKRLLTSSCRSVCLSARPSVRKEKLDSHFKDFHKI